MGQNIYLSIRIYKYIHENEDIFIWHEIFETRVYVVFVSYRATQTNKIMVCSG